ncbi:MAG: DUF6359 domain-containing protein [Candidatus Cryptobacteroides sp.]
MKSVMSFSFGRGLFPALCITVAMCLSLSSCGKAEGTGILRLKFSGWISQPPKSLEAELPDTNDFILKVSSADGAVIYSGKYGYAPESLEVPAGNCYVSIRSAEEFRPGFSCPLFGDDKCVAVPSGGCVDASLECTQLNSGIRLNVSPGFLTGYPDGVLFLRDGSESLMYAYLETRTAYFLPGIISLSLVGTEGETVLMTRMIEAREMLTINVTVPERTEGGISGGLSVKIDTSRVWSSADCHIGEDSVRGTSPQNALSVSEAKANPGLNGVWVTGYIVGGDLTSSAEGISFAPPFKSSSNIAVASRAGVTSKQSCIGVALPSGSVRDALNLVSVPENVGRQVYLKGDIVESYYGIFGLKNVKDYKLK